MLEQYGILPNYTLLDDRVTLDVGLSWTDPDTRTTHHEHTQLQRGSAQAIRDFAPGNRFYARGLEIAIDAVDLGVDGVSVQRRRYCPRCGYSDPVLPAGTPNAAGPTCPRCGSAGLGDSGQLLDTVPLSHVTAEVRRDEAGVSDRNDQRYQRAFEITCAADIDGAHVTRSWYAEHVGLRCRYLRRVDLQWVNLGPRGGGTTRDLAGERITGPLFRVCAAESSTRTPGSICPTNTAPGVGSAPTRTNTPSRWPSPAPCARRDCCWTCRRPSPSATCSPCPV